MKNIFISILITIFSLPCLAAEPYPARPVRVIAPFAAGSTVDLTARLVAPQLSEQLGKAFVVENRVGASGVIAYEFVAKAAPDGHTLLIAEPGITMLPGLTKSLPFDTTRDFSPVTQIMRNPLVLLVNASLEAGTLKDFIALAQANPGKYNYASGGLKSSFHLYSELFNKAARVNLTHIPYNSELVAALLGGQVQVLFTAINTALPHVKSGKVRALAVTTDGKRVATLPDVPSMSEAGVSGMTVYGWHGLMAPAGVPRDIINTLQREVVKAIALGSVKEKFVLQGGEAVGNSPDEFSAFLRAQIQRWAEVIKSSGLSPE